MLKIIEMLKRMRGWRERKPKLYLMKVLQKYFCDAQEKANLINIFFVKTQHYLHLI